MLMLLAIIYSGYGVWNALNPRIKNISVKIDNLPDSWKGNTAVLLSDIHLGHIFGSQFLRRVVQQTNAQNPKAVFITGDLFDGMDGEFTVPMGLLNNIQARNGVYFVTGNHETYFGLAKVDRILANVNLIHLKDKAMAVDGVLIYGIDYPMLTVKKDIGKIIKSDPLYNKNLPSILLYHMPTQIEQAKGAGINLQLAGHTHKGQIFPFSIITRLIFGKYHNGLHTTDSHNIYTSSGTGAWGPTIRTGNHPEITVINFE